MNRPEFEMALRHVVELGCAENVDWLFENYGEVGVSQAVLDDVLLEAKRRDWKQVAMTLRTRGAAYVM